MIIKHISDDYNVWFAACYYKLNTEKEFILYVVHEIFDICWSPKNVTFVKINILTETEQL